MKKITLSTTGRLPNRYPNYEAQNGALPPLQKICKVALNIQYSIILNHTKLFLDVLKQKNLHGKKDISFSKSSGKVPFL
jgi:hypothetical protein